MPSSLPKNIIKLTAALLKHQAELWLGEEAVGIAGETLVEIGGDELQEKIKELIASNEGAKELLEAAKHADAYFQEHCSDLTLKGAMTLSFGDLPAVQEELKNLPKAMDMNGVRKELKQSLKSSLPRLSKEKIKKGAELYTEALQRAISSLKNFTLPVIRLVVLDIQQKVKELGLDHDEIKATLARIEKHIAGQPVSRREVKTPPGGLPPGSRMPFPRNANFTGREAELEKLAEALTGKEESRISPTVITQAVTGMGGIGKTQLAVEFAYQYGHTFKGVHWLDLREPDQLETEIARNGEAMTLPNWPEELPSRVGYTLQTWQTDGPRLVILDNFEEVELGNDILAQFQHPNLRVLLTSRRGDWPANLGLQYLGLQVFTPEESLKFLGALLEKRKDRPGALESLAEHLGHLPLALELAGRYLQGKRLAIHDYLAQLEEALKHRSMDNWRTELKSATGHDLSLAETFALSWEQVEDETVQRAFIMAGYLAPNSAIPVEIFERTLEVSGELCDECLGELIGLGLLRALEDGSAAIHPLMAEYARGLDAEHANLIALSEKLAEIAQARNHEVDHTGNYALYTPLLVHVRSVAEKTEEVQIEKAGELWYSLGYHIQGLADYAGAKVAYERALKIDKVAFGPDHPSVARDINNLGGVLQATGDFTGAKEAFENALRIDEAVFGPHHPIVAIHVNNLGGVLKALGDHASAKAAYERALKIDEAILGSNHPNVAIRVNNLGMVLQALGDYAGAKTAFERALKIDEAAFGPDHPSVARGINNVGLVLHAQSDLKGAKVAFKRALKIDEATFGFDHPNVAIRVNNLGMVLQNLGDYAGAKAAHERALRIDEAAFGPDHPSVASDISNLGMVLQALGKHAKAKAAYERALRIDEAAFGPNHPSVARDINNLGMVLNTLGDHAGAKAAYERALKIDEAAFGSDHPRVASDINNMGMVLDTLGDFKGAKAAYEQALNIDKAAFGPNHPIIARDVNNLGGVLQAMGDLKGAKAAYERALKINEEVFGPDHPAVAIDVNNLGGVLKAIGDHAGAKAAYERALKIDEAAFGPDHPSVARDVNNLALVLQAQGDHAGAKVDFKRALKIDEAAFGFDHPKVAIRVNNLGCVLQAQGDYTGAKAAFKRALKIDEAAFGPDHPNVATRVNNLGGVLEIQGDNAGAIEAYARALKILRQFLPEGHLKIKTLEGNLQRLEDQTTGDERG